MSEAGAEIVVAILALLGSLVGTFAGILVNSRLVNYRIEQLERKVDEHNRVVERVFRLEQADAVAAEELHALSRRVKLLERDVPPPARE